MAEEPTLSEWQRVNRRLAGLRHARQCYEEDWKEIAELAHPFRSRLDIGKQSGSRSRRRSNRSMRDNHGRRAARIMEAGIHAGLASESRPWFKLETPDKQMMEYLPVKEFITAAEIAVYDLLAQGTFYAASKGGWGECGLFGTEAGIILEHWKYPHVSHGLTIGEYWIANDECGVPGTLFRRVEMTVGTVIREFGIENVSPQVRRAYDAGRTEDVVNVIQSIEENTGRIPGRMDAANLPWKSLWWEENREDPADGQRWWLRRSGFHEKPFWASRWDVVAGDVYGFSPGFDALPELRELMKIKKDRRMAAEYLRSPPLVLPSSMQNTRLSMDPNALNFASAADIAAAAPLIQMNPQAVTVLREDLEDVRRGIDSTFYVDLFMAISSMQGIQPRTVEEIVRRHEEQLVQLGPMVTRANSEKLSVVVDRAFGIVARAGLLPPPQELEGMPLKVQFVSLLTNMQRIAGVREIEAAGAFVMGLAQMNPEVVDKFNFDQAVDEFARIRGTPPNVIRSDEDTEAIRKARRQQEQLMQLAAMAQPAKDATQAAETLNRMAREA